MLLSLLHPFAPGRAIYLAMLFLLGLVFTTSSFAADEQEATSLGGLKP
jgi:hypothetical protein